MRSSASVLRAPGDSSPSREWGTQRDPDSASAVAPFTAGTRPQDVLSGRVFQPSTRMFSSACRPDTTLSKRTDAVLASASLSARSLPLRSSLAAMESSSRGLLGRFQPRTQLPIRERPHGGAEVSPQQSPGQRSTGKPQRTVSPVRLKRHSGTGTSLSSALAGSRSSALSGRRSDQSAYPSQARANPIGIAVFG